MFDICCVADAGDVPMARVKMNAKHEYEFIANFKILQGIFRAKKIDKARYILYLVKCHANLTPLYSLFL